MATHRLLIEDVLLPGGEIDRAFEVLECAKSRLLWDLLVDRQVIQTHRQDSAAAERIERLAERRRGLEFLLGDRNPGQEAVAREWISEYEEIGKELRAIALQAVDDGNDVDEQLVCSTQDVREVLPNRTALVEFFVGRDGVVAFLLDHSDKWATGQTTSLYAGSREAVGQ